jgi:hypothetical protein
MLFGGWFTVSCQTCGIQPSKTEFRYLGDVCLDNEETIQHNSLFILLIQTAQHACELQFQASVCITTALASHMVEQLFLIHSVSEISCE